MKQFVVCLYRQDEISHFYRDDLKRRKEVVVASHARQVAQSEPSNTQRANETYFFDNEQDARFFADVLVNDNPGTHIFLTKTMEVSQGQRPAEITITRAKFTDKGYLPV